VMVEDTELKSSTTASDGTVEEETVNVLVGIHPGENVRASGSDVREGELVLESGTILGSLSGEIGTLTFIGRTEVRSRL
jgi:gephyrin